MASLRGAVARTLGVVAVLAPLAAAEAGPGEAQVALTTAGGGSTAVPAGVLLGTADLWLGVDELFWAEVSLGAGSTLAEGRFAAEALGGVVLALDVLAWVPWVEGLVGAVLDGSGGVDLGGRLGLGADLVLDPTWAIGALARLHLGPDEAGGPRVVGGLRLSMRFEP